MNRAPCLAIVASITLFAPTLRAAETASPPATAAIDPVNADAVAAERARVVEKGKRLGWVGLSLSFGGLLVALASAAPTNTSDTTIALASSGVGLAIAGVVLAGAGMRRTRHPEKFMRKVHVSAAPWLGRTAGATVTLRF